MKKLIIAILALLGLSQMTAQEYEYVPFVREGVKWVYYINCYHYDNDHLVNPSMGNCVTYRTLELKGDTVINGKTYKAMHKYSGDAINIQNDTIPIYLREEDKVVYGIIPDRKFYDDCPIYSYYSLVDAYNGNEFVLYDFEDPVAYWNGMFEDFTATAIAPVENPYQHLCTDTIAIGQHMAKRYLSQISESETQRWYTVEGVGVEGHASYTLGFFLPSFGMFSPFFGLSHVIEDGEIIYKSADYTDDLYLPVIREGVKWVNEKVIINAGDTTSYYYTYEFKGNHPETDLNHFPFKALYYKEPGITAENDSLIAGLNECFSLVSTNMNRALDRVIEQDRELVDLPYLYMFGLNSSLTEYYISRQREPFLDSENFVDIEPIVIDGVTCSRCAYIGEDGDTLAYVVEGIGFDSRDMGDLLTPFTRKPDPTADYQEYWGLSHVVKDGQIIYKGMRYRPGIVVGVDEVVADQSRRPLDENYYDLTGRAVGKDVPTVPGIYIHQGKKIVVR